MGPRAMTAPARALRTAGRAGVAALALVAAACAGEPLRPDGAACADDRECASGMCYPGICLDPEGDADGDGLTNAQERALRSDPTRADTDGDQIPDLVEVGPDLANPRDTDGDGIPDVLESAIADADLDCINDQFDAHDDVPETDLEVVARLVCRTQGVCAPPGLVTVACLRVEVDGALASQAVCDYSAVPGYDGSVELRCDGLDNDCDGRIDEDLGYLDPYGAMRAVGQTCVGTGACSGATGVVECDPEGRAVCSVNAGGSAFAGAEVDLDCDGVDNDCDGRTDDGVRWLDPDTGAARLYGEPCVARGVCGLVAGVVECAAGTTRGICSTEPGASDDQSADEVCDGADNDCDGETDEGLRWQDGFGRALAVGAPCGVGACAGGVVVCAPHGRPTCSTLAVATDGLERCNGVDDDCDGKTDEPEGLALGCPTAGVCAGLTLRRASCGPSGGGLVCEYEPPGVYHGGAERWCDGLDDDCDGTTDEDFTTDGGLAVGAPCVGQGACAGIVGVVVCADDRRRAVCSADLAGTPEVCNGVDDDCDGVTDQLGPDASGGGVCAVDGVCAAWASEGPSCDGGDWVCGYAADPDWEADETRCDGRDNDCDGLVDEGLPRRPAGEAMSLDAGQPPDRPSWPVAGDADALFLFGGRGGSGGPGGEPVDDLWRFDPVAAAWRRVDHSGGPGAREDHAVAWDAGRGVLLVHGGAGAGGVQGDLWVFDPDVGAWAPVTQSLGALPVAAVVRARHALAALGDDRILIYGGVAGGVAAGAGATPVNTPAALVGTLEEVTEDGGGVSWRVAWSALSAAPPRVAPAVAVAPDGAVFVVGGAGVGEPVVLRWAGELTSPWLAVEAGAALDQTPLAAPAAVVGADGALVVVSEAGSWRLEAAGGVPLTGLPVGAAGHLWRDHTGAPRLLETARGPATGRAVWSLAGDGWAPLARWAGPTPRSRATLAGHPDGRGLWLIGGTHGPSGAPLGDVWRFAPDDVGWKAEVAPPLAATGAASATGPAFAGAHGAWSVAGPGDPGRLLLLGGDGAAASQLWAYAPETASFIAVAGGGDAPASGERAVALAAEPGGGGVWAASVDTAGAVAVRRLDLSASLWTRWDAPLGGSAAEPLLTGGLGPGDGFVLARVGASAVTTWSLEPGGAWSGPVEIAIASLSPGAVAAVGWEPVAGATYGVVADPTAPRLIWAEVAPPWAGVVSAAWARRGLAVTVDPRWGVVGFGGVDPAGPLRGDLIAVALACE